MPRDFLRMMLLIPLLAVALSASLAANPPAAGQECRAWQECRQLALDAAARQDYDAFHDLAWRALQAGPKNDPALMTMLARAQSLSGRPGDALVMLRRLAALAVVTDAATSDDFARVRALPGLGRVRGHDQREAGDGNRPGASCSA